ncbi:MAG: hypothetical protein ACXWNQ_09470 [Anaerolineales bacterium]
MSGPGKIVLNAALITVTTAVLLAAVAVCGLFTLVFSASVADCAWSAVAVAWIDNNQNGSFDPGEPVLQNVALHVTDIQNHVSDVAFGAMTDQRGMAHLQVPISGCPTVDFEVYPDTPPGYRLTTEAPIRVNKNSLGTLQSGATYYFGFAKAR